MRYRVRLATDDEARELILPIWQKSLHPREEPARKLQWFYRESPHGPGQTFVLEEDSARAIGCAGLGVRSLWRRDTALRTGLFADLAVEPTHRSALPALTLVRAVKRHADEQFGLGYGFPNHRAIAVYKRAGFTRLGAMRRYARPLRSAGFLEPRIGKHLGRLAGAAIDRVLAAAAALAVRDRARARTFAWVPDFDERFDRLWLQARLGYPMACERTQAFLRWRFSRSLGRDYRIATLGDRTLHAYAIVHLDRQLAQIVDLFGAGFADLDALLAHLVVALPELGCASVSMRFLGTERIPELLASHGFTLREGTRDVMVSIGAALANDRDVHDVRSWYLTDLDEDA